MGRIHAKPTIWLLLSNGIMLGLCIVSAAHLVQLVGDGDGEKIAAFICLFVLIALLTGLQAHGTFFEGTWSSAIAGLLFGAIAFLLGLAALMSWFEATPSAAAGFAAFACAINLKRNTANVTPPAAGTCAVCGYDLRATPGRCPECGHVPEASDTARQRAG